MSASAVAVAGATAAAAQARPVVPISLERLCIVDAKRTFLPSPPPPPSAGPVLPIDLPAFPPPPDNGCRDAPPLTLRRASTLRLTVSAERIRATWRRHGRTRAVSVRAGQPAHEWRIVKVPARKGALTVRIWFPRYEPAGGAVVQERITYRLPIRSGR